LTISFDVVYGSVSQGHTLNVVIAQPDLTVIDFFPEDGYITRGV